MKYFIGSDHAGYELKEYIIETFKDIDFQDLGCYDNARVDYTDYANKLGQEISADPSSKGILVCGTGIGMSIAVNKHKGVRASLCNDTYLAKMSRMHNDSNVLCLGHRVIGFGQAEDVIQAWLTTDFEGGRHIDRLAKML